MITITKKEEDFRIYVQNEKEQYISSSDILECEKSIDKKIYFKVNLGKGNVLGLNLSREEMKALSELTTEVCKYLNNDNQLKLGFENE